MIRDYPESAADPRFHLAAARNCFPHVMCGSISSRSRIGRGAEAARRGWTEQQSYSYLDPDHFSVHHPKLAEQRGAAMSRYPVFESDPSYPYDRTLIARAPTITREDRQVCVSYLYWCDQVETERDDP